MRILVVEDEVRMANFIERGLKEEHYTVDVAHDGEKGLYLLDLNPYDLIVLDVVLPDTSGIDVCKIIRSRKIISPVLMLTARSMVKDKVAGLDSGADDYLTKPFAFDEFLARVRALLRKNKPDKSTMLKVGELELDQLAHKVRRAGKEIALANKEYSLLEYFMLNADHVITRTMISEHVWNEDFDSLTNVIDVYVHRLRRKINDGFKTELISSLRGTGYILEGRVK
jgi:two-component system, OmpR family, copper resistance phosphate regulon response regulator CusR